MAHPYRILFLFLPEGKKKSNQLPFASLITSVDLPSQSACGGC